MSIHRTQDQFISQIDMLTQRIMELQSVVLGQQQQLNGGNAVNPQQQPNQQAIGQAGQGWFF
jgi:hypothetical protein